MGIPYGRNRKRPSKSVFHGHLAKGDWDFSGNEKRTEVWGEVIPLAVDQVLYLGGWVDEWTDRQVDEWMDRRIDRWVDGWGID